MLLLVLLGIVYLMESGDADQSAGDARDETAAPANTGNTDSLPVGFRLHGEPDDGYTIALPFAVDASRPQPGITRYRYVGPGSQSNSEITDGYTVTITARTASTSSVEAVAAQEIQGERATVLEEPTTSRLAGEPVARYTTESELGNAPIDHYAFVPGNGFAYIVSVNIPPDERAQYQDEIDAILETLTFLDERAATSLASRIIPIAMLDYDAGGGRYVKESSGKARGCDTVVLTEHVLPKATATPLHASLQQLFAYATDTVGGWQNFIASQNDTLRFDHAEITGTTANIYLTGALGPLGGICDNPRAAIQIEETALAYPTVDSVRLYLNGELTDLTPDGRGE